MTQIIKTQCPHCDSQYPIPQDKLDNPNAVAKCANCQTKFNVNANRVDDKKEDNPLADFDGFNAASKDDELISDDMISDYMHTPDDTESEGFADFGELDDMNAWIEKQKQQLSPQNENSDTDSKIATDKKEKVVRYGNENKNNDLFNASTTTDPDGTDDWLQALLEDDHSSQQMLKHKDDSGLSSLMAEYDVDVEYAQAPDKEDVLDKINERLKSNPNKPQPNTSKPLIVQLMWGIGCLLLIALMWAQYLIFNVDTLITKPDYANKIQGLCSALSCTLPSTDLSELNIQSGFRTSGVHTASEYSDILVGLENQANNELIYPNIKVSLSDGEQLLGQFIATPEDYLTIPQKRIGAKQSKVVMFTVSVPANSIGSIQIEPFY